jgi:hypothetical protein
MRLSGSFIVGWSANPEGPWKTLAESSRLYAPGEEFGDAPEAVFNLDAMLRELPGDLYLRVSPASSGAGRCVLAGIDLVVLNPREESGEPAFRRAAEDRRVRAMRALLPPGVATPLGGVVKGKLVLQADQSPYVLLEDLEVPMDGELEIHPGVRILIAGPRRITVLGRLLAEGEPSAPIHFEPGRPSQADDWKGLSFPVVRAERPPAPSRIAYCRFVNAAEIALSGFAGVITQSHFQACLIGIRLRTDANRSPASCVITRNRFTRCQTGLLIEGGGAEITRNAWSDCLISIAAGTIPRRPALLLTENNVLGSRVAALRYPSSAPGQAPVLPAAGNHWGVMEAAAIVEAGSGRVDLQPALAAPVTPAGPDWEPE